MPSRSNLIIIVLLFIWISFFPVPIQQKCRLFTFAFLGLGFVLLLFKQGRAIFQRSDWPLWLFLAVIGLNVFFAQEQDIALWAYLDLALPVFLIFYLAKQTVSSEQAFNYLSRTISICSILVALLGFYEILFAFNPIYKYFVENPYYQRYISHLVRPMSTQFNPAVLGSYLLGCLPFNFFIFRQDKSRFNFLGALGLITNMPIIILVFSRGVFLALIGMVVFYLLAQRRYIWIVVLLVFLLNLSLLCTFLPYPVNRFGIELMFRGGDGIFSSPRLTRYLMTQGIIKEHPWVGLGLEHFRVRFDQYYPGIDKVPYEFMIADNMYLTILAETGMIGFLGFAIFIISSFGNAWKRLALWHFFPQKRLQLLMVLSAFVGLLANMAAYELFYWPNQYIFLCILIGCIEGLRRYG